MPFQYVPQTPYYQQMFPQQNVQQMPQMQPTQMPNGGLQGRIVTSKEEALGVPADFSGQPVILPDFGHGIIYVKVFNPNTGSADIREFKTEAPQQVPVYATLEQLNALRDEIASLKAFNFDSKGGVVDNG